MNIIRRAGVTGACLLIGAFLLFSEGCGFKNHPVPPDTVVPEAIKDLRFDADAKGVLLSWSFPIETIKGSNIEDLATFEIFRAEMPLKDYCGGCPIPFAEPLAQPGGVTKEDGKKRKAVYELTSLRPGYKYFFKVRSRTSWFAESADSNIITFIWNVPAKAPEGLTAKAGNNQVVLNWQPATALQDGSPIDKPLQYQILRSTGGKEFEKIGVVERRTAFIDQNVANNQKYSYQVQSQLKIGREIVSGGTSQAVSTLSTDLTPPAPPTGVTAVETDTGIKILWEKSPEEDLGSYKVYRRTAENSGPEVIGTVEPVYTIFVDKKATAGVRYYYSVTAVDKAKPANESEKSAEATTRH
ncbi:MAG: hypothetical protein Q8R88_07950 [Desulfoprunum sp.]|nr:hypothetical protein [Desulfoprunum sp.]